jgi:hypothetical protein
LIEAGDLNPPKFVNLIPKSKTAQNLFTESFLGHASTKSMKISLPLVRVQSIGQ